jgi:cytochrome c-type biogenesis protein CcmH
VVLLLLFMAAPAPAERGWSLDMSNDLMSPYCPGRTLNDCPSPQAAELRAWIEEQERQGRSRSEVEAQIERLYGDVVLSAPRAQGWGLAAYLVPVGLILVGGIVVAIVLSHRQRSTRSPSNDGPAGDAPLDPELERIVDEELRAS